MGTRNNSHCSDAFSHQAVQVRSEGLGQQERRPQGVVGSVCGKLGDQRPRGDLPSGTGPLRPTGDPRQRRSRLASAGASRRQGNGVVFHRVDDDDVEFGGPGDFRTAAAASPAASGLLAGWAAASGTSAGGGGGGGRSGERAGEAGSLQACVDIGDSRRRWGPGAGLLVQDPSATASEAEASTATTHHVAPSATCPAPDGHGSRVVPCAASRASSAATAASKPSTTTTAAAATGVPCSPPSAPAPPSPSSGPTLPSTTATAAADGKLRDPTVSDAGPAAEFAPAPHFPGVPPGGAASTAGTFSSGSTFHAGAAWRRSSSAAFYAVSAAAHGRLPPAAAAPRHGPSSTVLPTRRWSQGNSAAPAAASGRGLPPPGHSGRRRRRSPLPAPQHSPILIVKM